MLRVLIAALAIGAALFVLAKYFVGSEAPTKQMTVTPRALAFPGVGALGRIEPRSRLIRVSNETAETGGVVGQILVREGQSIKAGAPDRGAHGLATPPGGSGARDGRN